MWWYGVRWEEGVGGGGRGALAGGLCWVEWMGMGGGVECCGLGVWVQAGRARKACPPRAATHDTTMAVVVALGGRGWGS